MTTSIQHFIESGLFDPTIGKMAVAFGVAGAGIAFALQEVIASLAGWVAISFGNFYNTGDGFNSSASKEMSSISACCVR